MVKDQNSTVLLNSNTAINAKKRKGKDGCKGGPNKIAMDLGRRQRKLEKEMKFSRR